jgi:hypothetical protein
MVSTVTSTGSRSAGSKDNEDAGWISNGPGPTVVLPGSILLTTGVGLYISLGVLDWNSMHEDSGVSDVVSRGHILTLSRFSEKLTVQGVLLLGFIGFQGWCLQWWPERHFQLPHRIDRFDHQRDPWVSNKLALYCLLADRLVQFERY